MTRKEFEEMVFDSYGIKGDYPFDKDLETAVFRHQDNKKWFALAMRIPERKLGRKSDKIIDVVNLKCDPEIIFSLWQDEGIFPAYHMNKNHWITVCLDGSVSKKTVAWLTDISFSLTAKKLSKKSTK